MRQWMNLAETVLPPVNKEAIIAHMIDSVHSGSYWDHEAKNPQGDPMYNDDASMMAGDWSDDYDNPMDIESDEFRARVMEWAEARYEEIVQRLANIPLHDGCYDVHRKILVLPHWTPADGLGIYWTYDLDSADFDTPWADYSKEDHVCLLMHGRVNPQHVDWTKTVMANMDWYSGEQEYEMRLLRGSPVMLLDIEVSDETRPVGKVFRA